MKMKSMLMGVLALGCACVFGGESVVAQQLQTCDFLLNKDFKKNAKYYLCLFSASWCGPCRREMPRLAKTYVDTLKADPDIEFIHFSRDQNDEKALAWAKEHDVKFPVVKPKGGNPLDLHSRGIPHLFIVNADGKLLAEGHPASLFTDEKLRALKAGEMTVPETATDKARKAIAKLFPGWSLDTEVFNHDFAGIQANHRGRSNVTFVHPISMEVPAVMSRTVKLSDKNPCLSLCISSANDDADFLLTVRANGKDVLTNRLICTPDAKPWEDVVVPLADCRGSEAKVEVVFTANGWWNEFPYLSRVEVVEGNGDMRIVEGKETVDGYTWSYRAQNGEAEIVAENDGRFSAVSPSPVGSLVIPATLGGATVTHIGRDAFLDCSALTSVTIPESVERIGRGAFHDCTGLRSLKIPTGVKIIERDAFLGCTALTSITIPEGVTSIERGSFDWCCGLASVVIPSSVTHIGGDAFFACRGLTAITIPQNVTDIGWQAFRGCNALTSVTIPASVTNIHCSAFCDTGAMTSFRVEDGNRFYKAENGLLLTKDGTTLVGGVNGDVTIPSGVATVEPNAFEGRVALRTAVIPSGVKSIGDYAFKQCRGMTAVTIPPSVTSIGREAFSTCRGVKSIVIPKGVTVIRNSTFSCSGLTEVTIPSGVKTLERGAFSWCGDLKSVTFPEGLTSIGRDAFYNCGKLTSVSIPTSVTRIEQGAFHGCGSLTSVTIPATVANIDHSAFDACSKLKSVNVVRDGKVETMPLGECSKLWKEGRWGSIGNPQGKNNAAARLSSLTGPYGIRMDPDPGCEKGAEYVLKRLVDVYLPSALKYYGDPFAGKPPTRVFTVKVKRNDGSDGRKYTGPSWYVGGIDRVTVGLAKESDKWDMVPTLLAESVLTVCRDAGGAGFGIYVNSFVDGDVKGRDPIPKIKEQIRLGLAKEDDETGKDDGRLLLWRKFAPMWTVFEDLRAKHPMFIVDYCKRKNARYAEGRLPQELSLDQMAGLLGEVTGENVAGLFKEHGVERALSANRPKRSASAVNSRRPGDSVTGKVPVAQKLQECDFLLNKSFKKNAKYYLCLFSASWCGPCRREMPRLAKTYAETLKADPDIELIHFSRDQDDEKALAWAKEHDIKFPVVKPKGGNPLDLHSRGIPHLFIVKADGTLVEEGHPAKLFTEEKLRALKAGSFVRNEASPATMQKSRAGNDVTKNSASGSCLETIGDYTWSCLINKGEALQSMMRCGNFICQFRRN